VRDAGEDRAHRRELLGLVQRLALTAKLGVDSLALGHVAHDRRKELDGSVGAAMSDGDHRHRHLAPVARQEHRLARPETVPDQRRPDLVVDARTQPLRRQARDRMPERAVGREAEQGLARGVEVLQAPRQIGDRHQIRRGFEDRGEPLARLELEPQAAVEARVLDGDGGVVGQRQRQPLLDRRELARTRAADGQHGDQPFGADDDADNIWPAGRRPR
jgi:hypothetical protein